MKLVVAALLSMVIGCLLLNDKDQIDRARISSRFKSVKFGLAARPGFPQQSASIKVKLFQ